MMEFKADSATVGSRLDVAVANQYPKYTRSSLELLFDKAMVLVNGQTAKASYKVHSGDKILVDDTFLNAEPAMIEVPIIYEDTDVLVLDKPAGLLTHSKGALNLEPTVASFIKPKLTDKELGGNRAGIVHRLDRPTSGVIITAKSSESQKWLQKQFSQKKVKKTYISIIEGTPKEMAAIIDAPIARNPKKPQTFTVSPLGKPAVTEYKVLKELQKNNKHFSEIELRPTTGRTHQLRVHLSYIGNPIVGDWVYGHGGDYMYLHAKELEITLPNRKRQVFRASIPPQFKEFINA
jgi:23S rRNA pseudouridine1911/1915/1917 synthase